MRNRYELGAGVVSLAGSMYSFKRAYDHYSQYHQLKDVSLPFYKKDPVYFNGVESHNQIATRIEEELIPKENMDWYVDMGIAVAALALAYVFLRPKNA